MCMFTFPNKSSPRALIKGIERFECGGCPECLQKKSRQWALRCGMEARVNVGMMLTLTYDTYKNGVDGEENPVDTSLTLNKAHAQRFIKRLRKHYPGKQIKYIATGEYGKRTHRCHMHFLIFGVQFDDLRYYKKSKRGNIIYKSPTLEKIWSSDKEHNGGICTVDCVNPSAQVARYCTKYCAKDSGVDDTFMLFSRGIGESELLRLFNGKSYWIDGREYSIPRQIWQRVIEKKYKIDGYSKYVGKLHVFDSGKRLCSKLDKIEREVNFLENKRKKIFKRTRKYTEKYISSRLEVLEKQRKFEWRVESTKLVNREKAYNRSVVRREIYQFIRDNDYLYKRYLRYWKHKNEVAEKTRSNDLTRILQLPDSKYRSYKSKALTSKIRLSKKIDFIPPRSKTQAFVRFHDRKVYEEKSFAPLSRHYRANDTMDNESLPLYMEYVREKAKKVYFEDMETGKIQEYLR